jgi:hypothetical protein
MTSSSPKKNLVKVTPIYVEVPTNVKIAIEPQRSTDKLILTNNRNKRWDKCLKIMYACLIFSIVHYGIGLLIFMLVIPKSNRPYTISELTWMPYLLGFCCIHIPISLCVCKLEPSVNGFCDYFRFLGNLFTK